MSEWQPIETAPKDGTELLLYGHGVRDHMAYGRGAHVGWWQDGVWLTRDIDVWCKATHWMPLPEPPPHPGIRCEDAWPDMEGM